MLVGLQEAGLTSLENTRFQHFIGKSGKEQYFLMQKGQNIAFDVAKVLNYTFGSGISDIIRFGAGALYPRLDNCATSS